MVRILALTVMVLALSLGSLTSAESWSPAEADEMRLTKLAYRQFVLERALASFPSEAEELRAEKRAFVAALVERGRLDAAIVEEVEMNQVKGEYRQFLAAKKRGETIARAAP